MTDRDPLGPPIRPVLPPIGDDVWFPVPGKPHLERNARGQLRTNIPTPPVDIPIPWPFATAGSP